MSSCCVNNVCYSHYVDSNIFELVELDIVVPACSTVQLNINADNIYLIEAYLGSTSLGKRVIHLWCDLKECLRQAALKVICGPNCSCGCTEEVYKFNSLMLIFYTYFSYLQKYFDYNILFTELETGQLETYKKVHELYKKLKDICYECIGITKVTATKTGDCGCNGKI